MRLSVDLSILLLLAIALSLPAEHCQEAEIISPGFDFGGARAVRIDQGSNYLADQQFQIERDEEHIGQIQGDASGFKGPEIWEVMPEAGKDQGLADLPQLSLAIEPLSGFAPLVVGFRVFGTEQISYAKWELDMEGDNKFEMAEYGTPVAQVTYYNPGTYFPSFLFYDNRGQVIAHARGRVDVQGQPGVPMGAIANPAQGRVDGQGEQGGAIGRLVKSGEAMSELANPPPLVPIIEYFNGPKSARAGENVALTWKVLYADCGCTLDTNPVPTTSSFTYIVPMQGAPDTIYHQLFAYGEPCDHPRIVAKDLYISVQQARAPNAPTNLEFLGWGSGSQRWQPILRWKDNSNDEFGFKIYDSDDVWMGSVGPNVTTWSIPDANLLASSFEFKVCAYNKVGSSDFTNSVKVEVPNELDLQDIRFFFGTFWEDSYDYYINVYRPGPIVASATWTGTAKDLDLAIEGPGNYGLHARGTSPISLAYPVTSDDLINGSTWKISITNYVRGKSAQGSLNFTYPKGCSWAGTWDTSFGKMKLKCHQNGFGVSGTYDRDQGSVRGLTGIPYGTRLTGIWKQYPTYGPPKDAGDLLLLMHEDCKTFTGYWRYGNYDNIINRTMSGVNAKWTEELTGTRLLDLRASGSHLRFD